jgi:hypothetical protein
MEFSEFVFALSSEVVVSARYVLLFPTPNASLVLDE